eukprot:10768670-Alexandrium_andersonii.AAC.1
MDSDRATGNDEWATALPAVSNSFQHFPSISCARSRGCRPPQLQLLPGGSPQLAPPARAGGANGG